MKAKEVVEAVVKLARRERKDMDTERSYSRAAARFCHWCAVHREIDSNERRVSDYLSENAPGWSASSERVALCALVFMFRSIGKPLGKIPDWKSAQRPSRLPEWVTDSEARKILSLMHGEDALACGLMYGSGLRRNEAVSLRLRDVDTEHGCITIRAGKGDKDRTTCLPFALLAEMQKQMARSEAIWHEDREQGRPGVYVPPSVEHKQPLAAESAAMFWLFPARNLSRDPVSGIVRRHHLHVDSVATSLRTAARRSGLKRRITCHALRHGFATSYLLNGGTINELQELLGHANVATTSVYLHCLPSLGGRVRSPLDAAPSKVVPFAPAVYPRIAEA